MSAISQLGVWPNLKTSIEFNLLSVFGMLKYSLLKAKSDQLWTS
jgi:hypothetical protein